MIQPRCNTHQGMNPSDPRISNTPGSSNIAVAGKWTRNKDVCPINKAVLVGENSIGKNIFKWLFIQCHFVFGHRKW